MTRESAYEEQAEANRKRHQKEQITVAALAPFVMEYIPGLGQVALAGMVFDYLDPYGYNHVVNRGTVDTVVSKALGTVLGGKEAVATYFTGGFDSLTEDQKKLLGGKPSPALKSLRAKFACAYDETKAGDPSYECLSPEGRKKMLDAILAFATVATPASTQPELATCVMAANPTQMASICKNADYTEAYTKFYKANEAEFKKNAADAAAKNFEKWFDQPQLDKIAAQDTAIAVRKARVAILLFAVAVFVLAAVAYAVLR